MHQHSNQITPACFSTLFTNLLSIHTQDKLGQLPTKIYSSLYTLHPVVKNLINFKDQKFGNSFPVNLSFSNFKKEFNRNYLKVTTNSFISP